MTVNATIYLVAIFQYRASYSITLTILYQCRSARSEAFYTYIATYI